MKALVRHNRPSVKPSFAEDNLQHYAAIIESSNDAIISTTLESHITSWNPAAERLYGYTAKEAIGKSIIMLFPSDRIDEEVEILRRIARGEKVEHFETTRLRKNKTPVEISLTISPIRNSAGEIIGSSRIARDIADRKRAEQQLRQQAAALEAAANAIVITDRSGSITWVNSAFTHMTGYSLEEVLNKNPRILKSGKQDRSYYENMWDTVLSGEVWRGEIINRRKDGSFYNEEETITPVHNEGGDITHFIAIKEDVTDRKRAKEALRNADIRYKNTLDNMLEGCQIIGFDWTYLYVNDVAARQGKREKEELLGHTMMEVYPGIETTEMFNELRKCMELRVAAAMQNEFTFPDGSIGWFKLSFEPVPEGMFILSLETTEEKRLLDELKKHRDALEELVGERTAELEQVNRELEAFSYSVSHDLRAPLRHINGFVELLQRNAQSSLDATSQRYLETISASAKGMGTLIDELLEFSRMGRAELRKTKVEPNEVVAEAIKMFSAETGNREIDWQVSNLPEIQADPSMLRLVFTNLLSNALKYTRTRPVARISITCELSEKENVFVVRDNGVGFDMKYADKLFGVFQRLHSSDDFEGVGIGLANVRRIISRHGGRTWAEGEEDHGASFYFSMPVNKGEAAS